MLVHDLRGKTNQTWRENTQGKGELADTGGTGGFKIKQEVTKETNLNELSTPNLT